MAGPAAPPSRPFYAAAIAGGIAVCSLHLLMSNPWFHFLEGGEGGDILLAQALAEGKGFVETYRLGSPPCTVRPPGLALFFAALIKLFSLDLFLLKIANNLMCVPAYIASVVIVRRRTRSEAAAVLLPMFALSLPFWIGNAAYLYSGAAYMALSLSAIALLESAGDKGYRSRVAFVGFFLLSGLTPLVRSIGLALPAGAGIALALDRQRLWRPRLAWMIAAAAAALIFFGGWTARNYAKKGAQDEPYLSKLLVGEPLGSSYWLAEDQGVPLLPQPRELTPARFLLRLKDNTGFYLDSGMDLIFPPALRLPRPVRIGLMAVLLFFTVSGLIVAVRRKAQVGELFAATALFISWVWPFPHSRFWAEPLVILAFAGWQGARWWAEKIGALALLEKNHIPLAAILASAAVVYNLASGAAAVRDNMREPEFHDELPGGLKVSANRPEAWRSFLLLRRAAEISSPGDKIMFHSLAPCGLVTGRVCSAVPMAAPDAVMDFIDESGIRWVVMDDEMGAWGASFFSTRFLLPAIESHPARFQPAAQLPPQGPGRPAATLYRVLPR